MHNKKDNDFLINRTYNEFAAAMKAFYGELSPSELPELFDKVKEVEALTANRQSMLLLYSLSDLRLLYIGSNVKNLLGYEEEEILALGTEGIFRVFDPSHLSFPLVSLDWTKRASDMNDNPNTYCEKIFFGGIKVKRKNGKVIRVFLRQLIMTFKDEKPSILLYFLENIDHLIKGDMYWGRYVMGETNELTRFYTSSELNKDYTDMISEREKEVLLLINDNKSSKEIAGLLNISLNTVERHRKNMIARIGAKDSTALLQLCKMCEIL